MIVRCPMVSGVPQQVVGGLPLIRPMLATLGALPPVSADAEAHFRVSHYTNYIRGRMLKIDRVYRESEMVAK